MVRKCFFIIVVLYAPQVLSQHISYTTTRKPLKFNLGLAQSFMIHHSDKNLYLDGSLEYFAEKNLSIKGNCLWYIDNRKDEALLHRNAIVLFGAAYHIPVKSNIFSVGLQPGFTFTQPNHNLSDIGPYPVKTMPVLSISTSYSLFFARYCHFYLQAQYLVSRYRGTQNASLNLDEFMISGGLGFQFFTSKKQPRQ